MRRAFYRTDYLFPIGSFIIGIGSLLSIFSPYYEYNCSETEDVADSVAIESDFATIGNDIKNAISSYKFSS